MRQVHQRGLQDSYDLLTELEKEILQLLAEGKSNKEVAALLNVSHYTVAAHRTHIMQKVELHSVTDIILYAVRKKIISRASAMGIASDFILIVLAGLLGGLLARAVRLPLLVGYVARRVSSSVLTLRIPMMSISHSDLMPIRTERSDAGLSQCEIVIDIRQ
jgi:DNA-binding CsgD family transcriptional regulator